MIDAAVIAESRRLLNQARMIAEASAGQASEVGRRHPSSHAPPGAWRHDVSTLEQFGKWINQAISHDSEAELRAVLRRCASELSALQHGQKAVPETPAEFAARIIRDYPGVIAPTVAARERCSVTLVRSARVKAGRTARLGMSEGGLGAAGA